VFLLRLSVCDALHIRSITLAGQWPSIATKSQHFHFSIHHHSPWHDPRHGQISADPQRIYKRLKTMRLASSRLHSSLVAQPLARAMWSPTSCIQDRYTAVT